MTTKDSVRHAMPSVGAWQTAVRCMDRLLRRAYGLAEWSDDPACLLRFRVVRAEHAIALPDREIPPGAPVIELHFWNEHFPPIPASGPDIGWAVQLQRMFIASFHGIAQQIQHDPQLADVQAFRGITVLIPLGHKAGEAHIPRRLGFTVVPYRNPLGRFGEFWENLYTWWLIGAFSPQSLKGRHFFRMRRVEVWMSVEDFLRRYGPHENQDART